MMLADALKAIAPVRSDAALEVLTLCCAYLQTGEPMPLELRLWLDRYLTAERGQITTSRSTMQGNLSVLIKQAGKVTQPQRHFAERMKLNESTVKKWRRKPEFAAIATVRTALIDLVSKIN